jgi:hypothetical protein
MPEAEVNAGRMRHGDISADTFVARAANSRKVPLLFINSPH